MQEEDLFQWSPKDQVHIEDFATKLFLKADKKEIRGRADLNTAKTFYAASLFIGILHIFGEVHPNLEQKQRYAAWRASEIRKSLTRKGHIAGSHGDSAQLSPERLARKVSEERTVENNSNTGNIDQNHGSHHKLHISKSERYMDIDSSVKMSSLSRSLSSSILLNSATNDSGSDSELRESNHINISFSKSTGSTLQAKTVAHLEGLDVVYSEHSSDDSPQQSVVSYDISGELVGTDTSRASGESVVYRPSAERITQALKASKMAVSSLSFNDVPSAVSFLNEALDLLTSTK